MSGVIVVCLCAAAIGWTVDKIMESREESPAHRGDVWHYQGPTSGGSAGR